MIGVKSQMTVAPSLMDQLTFFRSRKANSIMRQGLTAAQRPIRSDVKSQLLKVRNQSPQATGATWRAVAHKVSYPSKRDKQSGYALVGIDKNTVERHRKTTANERRQASKTRGALKIFGKKESWKGKKRTVKSVRSYQKTKARLTRGAQVQINRPSKYWHLINDGFTHRSGTRFPGYKFVQLAQKATEATAVKRFTETLIRGIARGGGI